MNKLLAALTAALMIAFSAAGHAAQCDEDVTKLNDSLEKNETLAADVRAQAEDMVKQAKELCAAGNEEDGLSVASEAKSLLGVE